MDILPVFCDIDDFCLLFEPLWRQRLLADITISGIELLHKIRKGQFETSKAVQSNVGARQLGAAVLTA